MLIYLRGESVRRNGSGSELGGDDVPVSGPVAENGPAKEELLPGAPSTHHLRPHHRPRVRPWLKR